MIRPYQKARINRAAIACRALRISQVEIAYAVGASQGQVSRILTGKVQRASRLFEEVCLYVERRHTGITTEAVCSNTELVEALRATWDGSAAHAKSLATVIRSLAGLGTPRAGSSDPASGKTC